MRTVATHVIAVIHRGDDGGPIITNRYAHGDNEAISKYEAAKKEVAERDGFGAQLLTVEKEYRVEYDAEFSPREEV